MQPAFAMAFNLFPKPPGKAKGGERPTPEVKPKTTPAKAPGTPGTPVPTTTAPPPTTTK